METIDIEEMNKQTYTCQSCGRTFKMNTAHDCIIPEGYYTDDSWMFI